MAQLRQHVHHQRGHIVVVLAHQHRRAAHGRAAGCRRLHGLLRRGTARHRQQQGHGRPLPRRAVQPHSAATLPGEAIDLSQPQPGALADALGGEERLEHPRLDFLAHAGAGVADRQPDEGAVQPVRIGDGIAPHCLCREGQRAAVRHRVAGVYCQVQQRQLQFRRVGLHGGKVRREAQRRPDVATQRLTQQRPGAVLHPGIQLDPLRTQRLAAGNG